jgi:superfamily II DNA or RNA helicase
MTSSSKRSRNSQTTSEDASVASVHNLTPEEEKRYRFLLGQTDLFDQFLECKKTGKSPLDILVAPAKQPAAAAPGKKAASKRKQAHMDLEAEEDEEEGRKTPSQAPSILFTESPNYVEGGKLRPYQVQGLNWLISLFEHGINGILADEMGLGKTLQTLSLLGYIKFYRGVGGPHLLIAPKSTLHNWLNEVNRWIPKLRAFVFHGDKDERAQMIQQRFKKGATTFDFDLCITSYEICLLEKSAFKRVNWFYCVIDEAHRIKNENSMLSQIVREFSSKHRLLITGTPLQNNLHELWALLNFLLPDIFSSSEDFDIWFQERAEIDQDAVIHHLKRLLQPFLLRRLKADVEHTLLPKKEVNLYVEMTPIQRKWYKGILERELVTISGGEGGQVSEKKTRLLNIVMQLRKCCNHPYLFEGAEPGPPYTTGEHLIENAGKMALLDRLLASMFEKGSRVLLFSQMSRMLDIFEDYCLFRGYKYCRIDGQTIHEERIEAIEEFNRKGSDKFIFLLTTRAGGLGINLATADIVVLYDSDWNPQVDLQAQDRAHRIGQTKQVCVFRLITESSVEEKVLERALQKLRLDQLVIQQGKLTNANKALTQDEMMAMIKHGVKDVLHTEEDATKKGPTVNLEEILARGETKTKELMSKFQNAGLEDILAMDSTVSTVQDEQALQEAAASEKQRQLQAIMEPGRRERKAATYAVDGYYREAFGQATTRSEGPKKPPMPKNCIIHDYQFFPSELKDLIEKEILAHQKAQSYKYPEEEEEREQKQSAIDNAKPFTEGDARLKEELWAQGFPAWSKKDFQAFIRGCEHLGRDELETIQINELPDKTLEQVTEYSRVFWERSNELPDHERFITNIEKGEAKLERTAKISHLLRAKIRSSSTSKKPLKVDYHGNQGKQYTEAEDAFILRAIDRIGLGSDELYEQVRRQALVDEAMRFDWFLKTRSTIELQRRAMKLLGLIEREANSKRK